MNSAEFIHQLNALIGASGGKREQFLQKVDQLRSEESIVIFGAGGGGEWLLKLLCENGVEVAAFFDSDAEKWGTFIESVPVQNPAVHPLTDVDPLIVIALRSFGAQQEVQRNLFSLGYRRVILYSQIWNDFFYGPDTRIEDLFDLDRLAEASLLWKDELSRNLALDIVRFYTVYAHEMDRRIPAGAQYFPADVPLHRDFSCFIDCGAYRGDTISELHRQAGRVNRIIAFEPDTDNFQELSQYLQRSKGDLSEQLIIYPCGVWSETVQMGFSNGGDPCSTIRQEGGEIKQFVALDEVLFGIVPTFIKMDVEGAEVEALQGASCLIREHRPDLAICLYHRASHLWEIPLLVKSWDLGYEFFLRQHDYTMEVVMYATVKRD